MSYNSLILNIPHASTFIPEEVSFLLTRQEVRREALRLSDLYTDQLADETPQVHKIVASVARIVTDTERFTDDASEEAAKYGMGVIYTKTHDGRELRKAPRKDERENLLYRWYYPHHRRLSEAVRQSLCKKSTALIVDLHSYPETFDMLGIQNRFTPDVCVGFDDFHCDTAILQKIINWCFCNHYTCAVNNPFSGAIVPSEYYHRNCNVISFMLEIRRGLYMSESTFEKTEGFALLKRNLNELLQELTA